MDSLLAVRTGGVFVDLEEVLVHLVAGVALFQRGVSGLQAIYLLLERERKKREKISYGLDLF